MLNEIIKLEKVNFYYNKGSSAQTRALTNINMEIHRGEFVVFFGPSGCGKSSLLYMISGIDKPDSGQVYFNGHDLTKFSAKETSIYRQMGIGLIFQNFNLIPSLSVIGNIMLPMTFLGLLPNKKQSRAAEVLKFLNISDLANRLPYELSGGQQQRIGIARALANDPPVILADEPTGNLDSFNATKTMELLKELSVKQGKTIILVTHEVWCLKYVDRIFYMKDGTITKTETVKPGTLPVAEKDKGAEGVEDLNILSPNVLNAFADSLSSLFWRSFSQEEKKRAQEFFKKRFMGEFTYEQLVAELDRPYKDGGLGLWKQRAKSVAMTVERIIENHSAVVAIHKKLQQYPNSSPYREIENIRAWILEIYKGKLSNFQMDSMNECLQERIRNIITRENFIKVLSLPRHDGGVGFSLPTALKVSGRLDILMGKIQY